MYENIESVYDLRFNINYYGADYPIDSLAKRMENGTTNTESNQGFN